MRPPHELLREVEGLRGEVEFDVDLVPRPEYGLVRPLLRVTDGGVRTFGGPNQIAIRSPVPWQGGDACARARLCVAAGQRLGFSLLWAPPELAPPEPTAPERVTARIADTVEAWRSREAEHDIYQGPHHELSWCCCRPAASAASMTCPSAYFPACADGEAPAR